MTDEIEKSEIEKKTSEGQSADDRARPDQLMPEPVMPERVTPEQVTPATAEESTSGLADAEVESGTEPATQHRLLFLVKDKLVERAPTIQLIPRRKLNKNSRRDFLIYGASALGAATGLWWLLPDQFKNAIGSQAQMDSIRDEFLRKVLSFDDKLAESIFSQQRLVPTYTQSEITELPNNYAGQTPEADYVNSWRLVITGLAESKSKVLTANQLRNEFQRYSQITRLVCVEGWCAISGWSGLRFADLIERYPPRAGTNWIQLRSQVNLDSSGGSDPYFVSIDMPSALHPQTLLATHHNDKLLEVEHGAPLRLLVPMKLGLKNIKAITSIEYCQREPDDYWNQSGYSYYDGI